MPADTDIRAVTLVETRPARLKRRAKRNGEKPRHNRDLADKRYQVMIHRRLPDPKPTDTLETLGLDPGIARLITDSDGDVHQMDQPAQERLEQLGQAKDDRYQAIARLTRINPSRPGSRQVRKLRKEIQALNQKVEGIRNNQECRIARTIADKAARKKGQAHRNVACEKTQIQNMVRSARGHNGKPGPECRPEVRPEPEHPPVPLGTGQDENSQRLRATGHGLLRGQGNQQQHHLQQGAATPAGKTARAKRNSYRRPTDGSDAQGAATGTTRTAMPR